VRAVALAAVAFLGACAPGGRMPVGESSALASHDEAREGAQGGADEAAMDRGVLPCDDFYAFACGGWLRSTPLPDDAAVWTRSFGAIEAENDDALRPILERAAQAPADDEERRLGDFYASCMDEAGVERRGLADFREELSVIDGSELAPSLARLHSHGVAALFGAGVQGDAFDPGKVALVIGAPALGLPDRDDYLADDARRTELRARYEEHVARVLALGGDDAEPARAEATEVVAIERALARAALSGIELRDPSRVHHAMDVAGLSATAPGLGWGAYLAALHLPRDVPIDVAEPALLAAAGSIARTSPPGALRAYLRFHLLRALAPSLGAAFTAEDFAMEALLLGMRRPAPRWKRCLHATSDAMADAVAKRYVKEVRGAAAVRQRVLAMTRTIEEALRRRLAHAAWMDRATRDRAQAKLALLRNVVGYPETWRRYEALAVDRAAFARNRWSAAGYEMDRLLARVGRAPSRDEWRTAATGASAFYDPSRNEVVLPLGMFRAPMLGASAAASYGAMGMVIGHELSHGFDDEGRLYDERGELDAWWTPPTEAAFAERARCVAEEYDGFGVNGRLTLGEDLADLGGLTLAYAALEPRDAKTAQDLFLGFAQAWCTNARPEALRLRLATNPHAPARFRVNGTVSNMPEFAAAFACPAGASMVRNPRCTLW
jgi:putative endopeptidase